MYRLGSGLLILMNVVRHFDPVSSEEFVRRNSSLTNNSIPHNISGLTNKTLDDGIHFSCESTLPLKLPQSGVAGVFILSGLVLLTVGKCFGYCIFLIELFYDVCF